MHAYRPRCCSNGWLKGARQPRHAALTPFATAKVHADVSAPATQATATASSSAVVHTFCADGGTGVDVPPAHPGQAAGHVVCWLLHRRGSTRPLQNERVALQLVHAPPRAPHALLAVPRSQLLFRQQPSQLSGPHDSCSHEPLWQTRFPGWFAQFWHSVPPRPQALSWLPTAQMFPMQQPAHGVGVLQSPAATQLPPEQTWLGPHGRHAWPFAPQALAVVATTHSLPAQQPAQFEGPHVWAWHVRLSPEHACPAAQARHASPRCPHAVESVPTWQRPEASQQPPQFDGPHAGAPSQRPPPLGCPRHA